MFLKCFWLLRKPSDQKNIFIDERFDYIWIFMSTKIWRFSCTFCLAKISLWSVWRDLREAKCVDLVVNYMKIFKFLWISTQFQKFFKALRRLPKRLKTLELRSGDTHKNSNVPQMLLAFEETVWSKNIFIDERFDYIWIFMSTKIWRFSCTFCLAKISMECMERFKRSKMCDLVVNYMKIFKFLWISTQFQSF